jgi:hypothetical protein
MKRIWRGLKAAVRKVRSWFPRRKVQQALAFAVTLAVSAYVLWYLLPTWLAAFIVGVVVVHEFGHYFAAKMKGFQAKLPLFFPGIYMMMGATQLPDGGNKNPTVILIGPTIGMIASAGLMIGSYFVGFMPGVYAAGWMFLFQFYSGTFGSDGKAYRRAKHEADAIVPWTVAPVTTAVA